MTLSKGKKRVVRGIAWVLFIIYMVALVYFLFFSEQMGRIPSDEYKYSLRPLKEIRRYLTYIDQLGLWYVFLNLAGNVMAFVPFGFVLPVITRYRKFYQVFFLSMEFSLIVEIIQLVSKVGSFDVDDILLNTLGGVLGYVAYQIVYNVFVRSKCE